MRRLEEALHVRAERGTPMGSDELIHRLNLELSGEAVTLVTVPAEEAAMLTTEDNRIAPPKPPRRWPRFAAAFAAGLVLLIAAVGVPLLLFGGPEDAVTDPTTTSAAPTTTSAPATTLPPMVESWQRVGAEVMAPARAIFDMTPTPSGFLAVGFDPSTGDSAEALVFSSPDGVTWSRLAADDPALTEGTVIIYSITEGGPGLVAGGISCQDAVKPCTVRPTVWTSVDGASWTRSDPDSDVFTDSGAILDLAAIEGGVVAVGNIDGVIGARPAAWFSEDGLEWSRVFDGDWVDNTDVGVTGPHAVATTPDALLVGVGSAENQAGDAVGAVWVSPDGRSWERVAAESFASGTFINDVAWGPQGLTAVGGVGDFEDSEAAIWQSPDGYSWSRVDAADQPFDPTGELSTVAALDDGYVAGGPGFGGQGGPITLWTSPDGSTWNRVQTMEAGQAHVVLATGTGIAVGGAAFEAAAVWVGPVFDPYAPPPDPQPATTTTEAPEALPVPGLGMEWERIESEALDPGLIWAVASSDDLIVAVGEVQYFVDVDPAFGETPNGVVWVSTDGVEWTRIDDPAIFGGDSFQIIWDVVAGPTGFVASGEDGAKSVLWFSADGYTWQRAFEDDLGTPGAIEDLAVGTDGPGWIAAAIESDSPTGIVFTSVNGIDWVTVSDPDEVATLEAELRPRGHGGHSLYAFPSLADERSPVTHPPAGEDDVWEYVWNGPDDVWEYVWNGDEVMAVVRSNIPEIWISPDVGVTWYLVDQEQPAFDGVWPTTQMIDGVLFDGKYVVVGFDAAAAAVWRGTWPEP